MDAGLSEVVIPVTTSLYIPQWLRDALIYEGWTPPPDWTPPPADGEDDDRTQAGP